MGSGLILTGQSFSSMDFLFIFPEKKRSSSQERGLRGVVFPCVQLVCNYFWFMCSLLIISCGWGDCLASLPANGFSQRNLYRNYSLNRLFVEGLCVCDFCPYNTYKTWRLQDTWRSFSQDGKYHIIYNLSPVGWIWFLGTTVSRRVLRLCPGSCLPWWLRQGKRLCSIIVIPHGCKFKFIVEPTMIYVVCGLGQ